MRDLLTVLGIDRVTLVGHSFGGGVAMQFAYQFPERTERLVLVGSGGLGPEVTPVIRAITTPGFEHLMGPLTLPGVRHVAAAAMRALKRTGMKEFRDFDEVAAIYETFREYDARSAIAHVTRAVVDWRGQVVTMADRAYLTEAMPLCVIWGEDDRVIPASHADLAAAARPRRPRRGDRQRRPLPAQGPPRAVRADRQRLRAEVPAGDVLPGEVPQPAPRGPRPRGSYGAAGRDRHGHPDPLSRRSRPLVRRYVHA